MDCLGTAVKKLREEKLLTLKNIEDALQIDQAVLCKIEKGQRKATRDQVIQLARFFKVKEKILLTEWLSDKLVGELENEPNALQALQLAEEKVKYRKRN